MTDSAGSSHKVDTVGALRLGATGRRSFGKVIVEWEFVSPFNELSPQKIEVCLVQQHEAGQPPLIFFSR
jgi:hypothetical protein